MEEFCFCWRPAYIDHIWQIQPTNNTGTFNDGKKTFLTLKFFNQRLLLFLVKGNCMGAINIRF
jgi:hypothetical protein